jgi:hypothetical protein
MRDQDMIDVDVTSPGIWERESDAMFEELKHRELEDEANGIVNEDPSRPRVRGGRLTEQNLKMWLSVVRSTSQTCCVSSPVPRTRGSRPHDNRR